MLLNISKALWDKNKALNEAPFFSRKRNRGELSQFIAAEGYFASLALKGGGPRYDAVEGFFNS